MTTKTYIIDNGKSWSDSLATWRPDFDEYRAFPFELRTYK